MMGYNLKDVMGKPTSLAARGARRLRTQESHKTTMYVDLCSCCGSCDRSCLRSAS